MATLVSTEAKPDPKSRPGKKQGGDRWRGEVKGIVALAVAGFALVALAMFQPGIPPSEQASPVGPVGVWLGWVAFQSFGYGAFLFPVLVGAWGAAAFVRPLVTSGWVPLAGIAVLLVSATGLLTQASSLLASGAARPAAVGGGLVGWAVTAGLRAGVGNVGTWFVLLAAVPVGMLLGTRVSSAALARLGTARLAGLRGRKPGRSPASKGGAEPTLTPVAAAAVIAGEAPPEVVRPPVVVEP